MVLKVPKLRLFSIRCTESRHQTQSTGCSYLRPQLLNARNKWVIQGVFIICSTHPRQTQSREALLSKGSHSRGVLTSRSFLWCCSCPMNPIGFVTLILQPSFCLLRVHFCYFIQLTHSFQYFSPPILGHSSHLSANVSLCSLYPSLSHWLALGKCQKETVLLFKLEQIQKFGCVTSAIVLPGTLG